MTITDAPAEQIAPGTAPSTVRLPIEYWTVTMDGKDSCGECDATLTLLNDAVTTIRPLAEQLGITLDVVSRTITTWSEAFEQGIVASPTIRAQGLETRPVHPDDSEARVWHWRETTTPAPRPEALLDFLVQAVAQRSQRLDAYLAEGGPAPYVRRFLLAPGAEQTAPTTSCGPTCG